MDEDRKQRWRSLTLNQLRACEVDAADRVRTQATIAQDTLKAMMLANGGALVALFAFLGNVLAKGPRVGIDGGDLRQAFAWFAAGFALALLAHVAAFLSQDRFYYQAAAEIERLTDAVVADEPRPDQAREARLNRHGRLFYIAGLAIALLSMVAFVAGCWMALAGVQLPG